MRCAGFALALLLVCFMAGGVFAQGVSEATMEQAEQAQRALHDSDSYTADDTSTAGLYCDQCVAISAQTIYSKMRSISSYQEEVSKKQALNNGEAPPEDERPQFNMEMSRSLDNVCPSDGVKELNEVSQLECEAFKTRFSNAFDDFRFFMGTLFAGAFTGKTADNSAFEYADTVCRRKLRLCGPFSGRHDLREPLQFTRDSDDKTRSMGPIASVPDEIDPCSVCVSLADVIDSQLSMLAPGVGVSPDRSVIGALLDTVCDSVGRYYHPQVWARVRSLCQSSLVDDYLDELEYIFSRDNSALVDVGRSPVAVLRVRTHGMCVDTTDVCSETDFDDRFSKLISRVVKPSKSRRFPQFHSLFDDDLTKYAPKEEPRAAPPPPPPPPSQPIAEEMDAETQKIKLEEIKEQLEQAGLNFNLKGAKLAGQAHDDDDDDEEEEEEDDDDEDEEIYTESEFHGDGGDDDDDVAVKDEL